MKLSRFVTVFSEYLQAHMYSISAIKGPSDAHLLWGPLHARRALGIGAKNFSLYSLAEVPKASWQDYLVNEPLKARYAAITSTEARQLADDKILFFEHCRRHDIPTAPIIALISAQAREGIRVPQVYSVEALGKVLTPGEYFVKPSNGSHGQGTFSLSVTAEGLRWQGREGTIDTFFAHCVKALGHTRTLIVQPKLSNHSLIRKITHARGLSTIRIVTVRKAGQIKIIGAALRIVVGDSEVDNFSHGASGNLVAGVDIDSGKLVTAIGSKSRQWPHMIDVSAHPRSGEPILGVQLPCWAETVALAKQAHAMIDSLHTVGWDIAVTEDGPLVVEANWRYDIDILQVAYKKGYRKIIGDNIAC